MRRSRHVQRPSVLTLAIPLIVTVGVTIFSVVNQAGWILVAISFVVLVVGLAERSHTEQVPGVMFDHVTRRYSRPGEWQGVMEVEAARSAPERRLLLAREFRRLAEETLAAPPDNRKAWPPIGRLAVLRRQANVLLASATDRNIDFLPEQMPDDSLTQDALTDAVACLHGYLALLQAVHPVPRWDLELLRVVTRERNRLVLAHERILELLSET